MTILYYLYLLLLLNYLQCLAVGLLFKHVKMWLIHMNVWSQEKNQSSNHSFTQRTHTHTHTFPQPVTTCSSTVWNNMLVSVDQYPLFSNFMFLLS
jgi:hypothetical protein